jgi:hypothetical protein
MPCPYAAAIEQAGHTIIADQPSDLADGQAATTSPLPNPSYRIP